ncbi:quinol:cytochrome C oxidoreductase [Candidatus Marinamargulisbacteria bacterium SCGC AG-333-B06]|nr:quinol:cytochrome C oxidoreductase [Candidatus Marinamargulisbacteria bacterium SCGC AG-333-B06]
MVKKQLIGHDIDVSDKFSSIVRKLFMGAGLFLFISFILFFFDKHYFYFSYLTSYMFFLTLTLGAMFIVLLQYVTSAGWSVVIRRVPEVLMSNIPLMLILFIPILFGMHDLYHWTHLEEVMHDHLLQVKRPFLNTVFFVIRVIFYFVVWSWIVKKFFKKSVLQDETGDHQLSIDLERSSTYSMILFALTITFAAVDLVMSITPHWYSTIFGVYIFAGAALIAFSVTSLMYMFLRKQNLLKDIVTIEHYHDLGKLIYGFNIFWSYIAFCQFFLIWYASVPEETDFYLKHFEGSWSLVTILLCVGHFGVPFVFFISRWLKRNLTYHACMVGWICFMHFVDLYWIIIPNVLPAGFSFHFIDITLFLGIASLYFAVFFKNLNKVCLIPKKDPRLSESLNFVNF